MRILVALWVMLGGLAGLGVAACGEDHGSSPKSLDAAPIVPADADQNFCDAPVNSSHVSIVIDGVATAFTSVHAGGTLSGGDVAPLTTTPMSLLLEFVDEDHLPETTAFDCSGPNQGCALEGVVGRVDCIGCDGTDLGPHPITLQSLQHDVTVQGTLTITDFVQPFDPGPGHISGSISTPGAIVTGTFGNDFCALLLSETI